jgi:ATP-binding cassette subfamily C protein
VKANRHLLEDLMRRLGWRFPVLVIWTAAVGLSESMSVVLLLPLLSHIGVVAASTQGLAVDVLKRGLTVIGATDPVEILAVIIAISAIQTALSVTLNWWTNKLARSYQRERQLEIFGAFMHAKWSFVADRKGGEVVNAIITETERLGRGFTICLSLLASAIVAVVYVVFSLLIAWPITLWIIGISAAAALTMTRLYKKSYAVGQSLAPLNAELQSALSEYLAGAKYIKATAGENHAAARVEPLVRKLESANTFANSLPGTVRSLLETVALIGLAILLVLASKGAPVVGGNAVVVLALFGRFIPRLNTVQAQLQYLNNNVHAIEVVDALQAAAEAEAERVGGANAPLTVARPATLVVRGLQVKLGDRTILNEINMTLPVPGMLAVVGRSGVGKSTLVHTLLGLVEPVQGSIRLSTHDLAATSLRSWRRAIGYVPQETILFHASIRDNLTLVNPAASKADIVAAARRAHALEFIETWPNGFDTIIGDQGVKLSGGQRQRLGIARALMTDPVLLILDEAMSALDGESEAEIIKTLEELRSRMGILLVAHRLAAVRSADMICVLDRGRIVESGTWGELMSRKTLLRDLANQQSVTQIRSIGAV